MQPNDQSFIKDMKNIGVGAFSPQVHTTKHQMRDSFFGGVQYSRPSDASQQLPNPIFAQPSLIGKTVRSPEEKERDQKHLDDARRQIEFPQNPSLFP